MSIVFSVGETTHFSAWAAGATLLSYGHLVYTMQEGDRIWWHQAGGPDGVALDAWIDSESGSRWHFVQLVCADHLATATRARLLERLEALAGAAGSTVDAAGAGPGPVCLVGTIGNEAVARGKTLATWNGIPSGSPYFELTVRVLDRPVQVCPGWGPQECLPTVSNPARRASLATARTVLAAASGARVRVVGQWSTLRVVPPDTPDEPRQRPLALMEPFVLAEPPAELEALLGETLPEKSGVGRARAQRAAINSPSVSAGATIDPVLFFWCRQATCSS